MAENGIRTTDGDAERLAAAEAEVMARPISEMELRGFVKKSDKSAKVMPWVSAAQIKDRKGRIKIAPIVGVKVKF